MVGGREAEAGGGGGRWRRRRVETEERALRGLGVLREVLDTGGGEEEGEEVERDVLERWGQVEGCVSWWRMRWRGWLVTGGERG